MNSGPWHSRNYRIWEFYNLITYTDVSEQDFKIALHKIRMAKMVLMVLEPLVRHVRRQISTSNRQSCASCPIGKYSLAGSSIPIAGRENMDRHLINVHIVRPSPAANAGAISCDQCPTGKISANDYQSCTFCPAGKKLQQGSCYSCLEGTYGFESVCHNCPPGRYVESIGATSCIKCPAGKSSPERSSTCSACPQGKASLEGEVCGVCDAGKYTGEVNSPSCNACPAGKATADTGATTCTDCETVKSALEGSISCTDCEQEKYAASSGMATCLNCMAVKAAMKVVIRVFGADQELLKFRGLCMMPFW